MTEHDVALKHAIHHLRESATALQHMVQQRRRNLREAYGLAKDDGSRITPIDLYHAVKEMASGYGGEIGDYLHQAAGLLYKAQRSYRASLPAPAEPAERAQPSRQGGVSAIKWPDRMPVPPEYRKWP